MYVYKCHMKNRVILLSRPFMSACVVNGRRRQRPIQASDTQKRLRHTIQRINLHKVEVLSFGDCVFHGISSLATWSFTHPAFLLTLHACFHGFSYCRSRAELQSVSVITVKVNPYNPIRIRFFKENYPIQCGLFEPWQWVQNNHTIIEQKLDSDMKTQA